MVRVARLGETQRKHAPLLIVDDDPDLCDLVQRYLEAEGFVIFVVDSGADGSHEGTSGKYDLIVLDVMAPDMKGLMSCGNYARRTPVLRLTAKGDELTVSLVSKWVRTTIWQSHSAPRELIARIGAILRRSGWQSEQVKPPPPPSIKSGDLELDLAEH